MTAFLTDKARTKFKNEIASLSLSCLKNILKRYVLSIRPENEMQVKVTSAGIERLLRYEEMVVIET
jgi:hypothetical protein